MSHYFNKKQQFNRPRDIEGNDIRVIPPGKYSEYDLVRWHAEWKPWRTADNLPTVWVSPSAEVASRFPDQYGRFKVMSQQWLSSCPTSREQLLAFQDADQITDEITDFLRELGDGYLYVWLAINQFFPGQTLPVPLHRLVAECFVERNDHCFEPDKNGKWQLRDDLHVDHLDSDRSNNRDTNLVWVPSEVNKNWIGWTLKEKLMFLEGSSDIYVD